MKTTRHESLGIYIYADPQNKREKDFNDRMTEKAEAIRCRRYESVVNERYDFFDKARMQGDFRPIGKVPWLGQAHPISQIS